MSDETKNQSGTPPNAATLQQEFRAGINALGVLELQKAQLESDIEILKLRLLDTSQQLSDEIKKRSGLVVVPPGAMPPNPPQKK